MVETKARGIVVVKECVSTSPLENKARQVTESILYYLVDNIPSSSQNSRIPKEFPVEFRSRQFDLIHGILNDYRDNDHFFDGTYQTSSCDSLQRCVFTLQHEFNEGILEINSTAVIEGKNKPRSLRATIKGADIHGEIKPIHFLFLKEKRGESFTSVSYDSRINCLYTFLDIEKQGSSFMYVANSDTDKP
jgi:hypothetical protein